MKLFLIYFVSLFLAFSSFAGSGFVGPGLVEGMQVHDVASGNVVLTKNSETDHFLFGTGTAEFQLPNATGLPVGRFYRLHNFTDQEQAVFSNVGAGTQLRTIVPSETLVVKLRDKSTAEGVWEVEGTVVSFGLTPISGVLGMSNGGTGSSSIAPGVVKSNGALLLSGAVDLNSSETTGTLPLAKGGTGQTSFAAGVLQSNGTVLSSSPLSLSGSGITGTLPIANGGTGQTTANAALNALLPTQSGQAGKYLKTDGTNTEWDLAGLSSKGQSEGSAVVTTNLEVPYNQLTTTATNTRLLETGNTNMLVNGSFEHSTQSTGWTLGSGVAMSVAPSPGDYKDGAKGMALPVTGTVTGTLLSQTVTPTQNKGGEILEFSIWANRYASSGGAVKLEAYVNGTLAGSKDIPVLGQIAKYSIQVPGSFTISSTYEIRLVGTSVTTTAGFYDWAQIKTLDNVSGTIAITKYHATAVLTVDQINVNPNNNAVKINVNSREYDPDGVINTATSRIEVKEAGAYQCFAGIQASGTNVLNNAYAIWIYKNGSFIQLDDSYNPLKGAGAGLFLESQTRIIEANSGDYFELYLYGQGNNNSGNTLTVQKTAQTYLSCSMVRPKTIQVYSTTQAEFTETDCATAPGIGANASGSWNTNTTYTCKVSRKKNLANFDITLSMTGGPNVTSLAVNLPGGIQIDTAKWSNLQVTMNRLGDGSFYTIGAVYPLQVNYNGTTNSVAVYAQNVASTYLFNALVSASAPVVPASGDKINLRFSVPVAGWVENPIPLPIVDPYRITAEAYSTAGQSIPNNTATIVNFGTKTAGFDDKGAITTGAGWRFTAPWPVVCTVIPRVGFSYIAWSGPSVYLELSLVKNSVTSGNDLRSPINTSAQYIVLGRPDIIKLNTGDWFDFRVTQANGAAVSLITNASYMKINIDCKGDY